MSIGVLRRGKEEKMPIAVEDFVSSPSDKLLEALTKDQVAQHYEFHNDIPKGLNKNDLLEQVKSKLLDLSIISVVTQGEVGNPSASSTPAADARVLSFDQQAELLKMQTEQKQIEVKQREKERELEMERLEFKRLEAEEREKERQFEMKRLETEREHKCWNKNA